MITWGEFKRQVEANMVTDDCYIEYIDVDDVEVISVKGIVVDEDGNSRVQIS